MLNAKGWISQNWQQLSLFSFGVLIIILYRGFAYTGHFGFDDMEYAKGAAQLLEGSLDPQNHFSYRIFPIALTAFSYLCFGINDFSSSLPAMLVGIASVALLLSLLKSFPFHLRLLAIILISSIPWYLFYTNKLMPDIYVSFSILGLIYGIEKGRIGEWSTKKSALVISVFLLLGFMSKGTLVLILPVLAVLFLLFHQELWELVKYSLLFTCLAFALYFLATFFLTGSFLSRFAALSAGSYVNDCSYHLSSWGVIWNRLSFDFWEMLAKNNLLFICLPLVFLPALMMKKIKNELEFSFKNMAIIVCGVALLSANFMSISFSHYNPMCIDIRHYLFLVPIGIIGLIVCLEKKEIASFIIGLTAITLLNYVLDYDQFFDLHLPLSLLLLLIKVVRHIAIQITSFITLVYFASGPIIGQIEYAETVQYRAQREEIKQLKEKGLPIISNLVEFRLAEYENAFNGGLKQYHYHEASRQNGPCLILRNWYTEYLSGLNLNDIPISYRIGKEDELVYKNERLNIQVYKKEKYFYPSEHQPYLSSSMGFNSVKNWNIAEWNIVDGKGEKFEKVGQYSSTFQMMLDSSISSEKQLYLEFHGEIKCTNKDQVSLVCSIDKKGKTQYYESIPLTKQIRSKNDWWGVKYYFLIDTKADWKGAKLKVYLFNPKNRELYLKFAKVILYPYKI
jgi:hypothetical protein